MRDLRISADGKMGKVRKDPLLMHRCGDFRVGLEARAAEGNNFLLITKHNRHVREVRDSLSASVVSGGVRTIMRGVQTEIKCPGKRVIVKTFRDGTKQVA